MQCFQVCALIFFTTVLQSCAANPLGIRVHALGKQFDSLKDKKLDYYELDDEAENEFDDYDSGDDVDNNDKVDHDAIDDEEYDDYDDNNEVNDESFDQEENNHEDDDDAENVHYEMSDENGVGNDFSAPTKPSHYYDADEDEDDEISGYRPDVALTSPLEYYS